MPAILYVVATPIGNLEDVTLRGLRILREVSLIAAEDTRRTSKLLQHYSISTPATSLHEHNEHAKGPRLIERLRGGESIALVSDAGTPAISDPGARLVAAAHAAGIVVQPVPGPSALAAVVCAAGLQAEEFTFVGFPPSRSTARTKWFAALANHPFAMVLYEAPHRIEQTLRAIQQHMGERRVAVGRELTKIHEVLAVRPISMWLQDPPVSQGEFVLLIFPPQPSETAVDRPTEPVTLATEFWRITNNSTLTRREAIRAVARRFNVRNKDVFDAIEAHPNSGE
jgi:16S rRNA (cytidine1402-2'-O)-methyltransferase